MTRLATRKRMALEDGDAKMYGVCSRWCGPFIRTARSVVGKQATTGLGTSQLAGTEHNDVLPLLASRLARRFTKAHCHASPS